MGKILTTHNVYFIRNIQGTFYLRNPENQCWKKSSTLPSFEDFQFLVVNKLFSESEDELAENIEKIVRAKGFQDDETFPTYSNISIECLGSEKWGVVNSDFTE